LHKVSLESEAVRMGIDFRSLQTGTGPDLTGALRIIRYANATGIDLIHSHGYKSNILIGFIPRKIRKLPLVVTLHGWTSAGKLTKLRLYEWFDIKSLKRADAVVAVSKATANHQALRRIRTEIIYNGISKTVFKGKDQLPNRQLVQFCENGFTIGSVGRLSPEKGYRYLIDAFSILAQRYRKIRLVIIGDGKERNDLQTRINKMELEKRILLAGYQPDAVQYIPLFKIFVLSSLTEGLPITILEAMQAKVPVISTKVGGVEEMLANNKTALLIRKQDPIALSIAIQKLYQKKQLSSKIAAHAQELSMKKFSSETMAGEYSKLYNKVLCKN